MTQVFLSISALIASLLLRSPIMFTEKKRETKSRGIKVKPADLDSPIKCPNGDNGDDVTWYDVNSLRFRNGWSSSLQKFKWRWIIMATIPMAIVKITMCKKNFCDVLAQFYYYDYEYDVWCTCEAFMGTFYSINERIIVSSIMLSRSENIISMQWNCNSVDSSISRWNTCT